MLWAIILEPGKKYSRTFDEDVVVTGAALETPDSKDKSGVVVNCIVNNLTTVIAHLKPGSVLQRSLNIKLTEGENVSFFISGGQTTVHLTGYVDLKPASLDADIDDWGEDDDSDEFFDSDDDDDSDDSDGDDSDEDDDYEPGKVEEIPTDEENDDSNEKKAEAKKRKSKDKKPNTVEASKLAKDGNETSSSKKRSNPDSDEAESKKAKKAKKKDDTISKLYKKEEEAKAEKQKAEKIAAEKIKAEAAAKKAKADAAAKKDQTKTRTITGGVQVTDLKIGNGQVAKKGKRVGMYYKGWLMKNNKQFDANLSGRPFVFKLGAGEVIKGWDVGVEGMRVGGKRRLVIPSKFGYGYQGAPPDIPGGASLGFDVECKSVK